MALPGGYDVGDEVFFTGQSFTYSDGRREVYSPKIISKSTPTTNEPKPTRARSGSTARLRVSIN